jgi:hypothetical protein
MSFYAVTEVKQTALQQKKLQAHYIARSGVDLVVKWLTSMDSDQASDFANRSFPVSSAETPFGNGSFTINISDNGDILTVMSTGKVPDTSGFVEDTVSVVLNKESSGGAVDIEYAIFARSKITTSGGGNINGDIAVNSSGNGAISFSGNPSLQNCIIHIQEEAEPSVVIDKPDWYVLPQVKADIPSNKAYKIPNSPIIPDISEYPDDLTPQDDISLSGNSSKTITGSGIYNNISIESNNTLTINVGNNNATIRIRNFNMPQGNIVLQGSGSLTLYIDNINNLKGYINKDGNHSKLKIYTSSLSSLSGETIIGGSLYIRNGSFSLSGGGKIEGDLFINGPRVSLSGGTNIGGSICGGNTDIIFSGGATVNGNIVTAGDSINMSGGTYIVNGVLYAPKAKVDMSGGVSIKSGGVVADSFAMSGGCSVTYDPDLASAVPIIVEDSTVTFEMGYWK